MNLFTKPMKLLTAVVMEQKSDDVVKALLQLGVMDFVHIDKLDPAQMAKLSSRPAGVSRASLEDMRHRVESLLRQGHKMLPQSESLDVKNMEKPDLDAYKKLVDGINGQLATLKESQRHTNQIALGLQEMQRYIEEQKYPFLDLRVGRAGRGSLDDLKAKLSAYGAVVTQSSVDPSQTISLTLRRDASQVNPLMDKFGWTETSSPDLQKTALSDVSAQIEKELGEVRKLQASGESQIDAVIANNESALDKVWGNLRLNELCGEIKSYFSYTRSTVLFSGWVPSEQSDAVNKAVYDASGGQCVIEWTDADTVPRSEVPVAVTAPKALMPFARIVKNYGTPEYGTVNPVPFVTIAYLAMFGLMFADVGQGLVLLLFGIWKTLDYRKHPEKKDGMINRTVAQLLIYLGVASMLFGALFGSYFGYSWLPALWFNFDAAVTGEASAGSMIKDVYGILGMTIVFGIIVIYTGLAINWINLGRKKAWVTLLLDKNGIVGGTLYGTGLYLGFGFVKSGYHAFPADPWIKPVITICVLAILARGFLTYALSVKEGGPKKSGGQVAMDAVMGWLVDCLEIFCGYMSNTLSFMRVAGLGIAHVCLMQSFQMLAGQVGGAGGIAVYVLGNLLVIVLEGLSAGIQALRLNYYEFFSRYFTGRGVAYEPVSLRRK